MMSLCHAFVCFLVMIRLLRLPFIWAITDVFRSFISCPTSVLRLGHRQCSFPSCLLGSLWPILGVLRYFIFAPALLCTVASVLPKPLCKSLASNRVLFYEDELCQTVAQNKLH